MVISLLGAVFAVAQRGTVSLAGLADAVAGGVSPRTLVPHGQVEVVQLDVGQGQPLILLRTRHHTLLYDAGPRSGAFDLGARVVLPSLRKLGVGPWT
jgi:competence protein ComEC